MTRFETMLLQFDERMRSTRISQDGRARIRARLREAAQPRTRSRPRLWFALGAGTLSILLLTHGFRSTSPAAFAAGSSPPGWKCSDSCRVTPSPDGSSRFGAGCKIVVDRIAIGTDVDLHVWEAASLSGRERGISLHAGSVTFDVDPIREPDAPPVEIGVPFGLIEVLGTRFAVRAVSDGGEVVLYKGRIRFRHASGLIESLQPGERLQWTSTSMSSPSSQRPTPAVAATGSMEARTFVDAPTIPPEPSRQPAAETQVEHVPEPRKVKPAPKRIDAKTANASSVRLAQSEHEQLARTLEQVSKLRRRGQYEEALRLLNELDDWISESSPTETESSSRTREVLSFEAGTLHKLAHGNVCAHWQRHLERFPYGSYRHDVELKLASCDDSNVGDRKRKGEP